MKKLMSILLGLSLVIGAASISFGAEEDATKKETKKKKSKKKKAEEEKK